MTLMKTLGTGQGHLKAGFLGFQASGKTFTAILLAIGLRRYFGLDGPIAFYDTEGGTEYIADKVKEETGKDLLGVRSRSFDDLCTFGDECLELGVSVGIADSVTHPWRELCVAYLKQVNAARAKRGLPPRQRLEFQDWGPIKEKWARWADFYLNSPLHLIVCGRAGDIYAYERDEERGTKELVKTGIKMKTETEFGFEPSLLIEMERQQVPDGKGGFKLRRFATVIKDRFAAMDGAECHDPTFEFFLPHVALLRPGTHAPVDTRVKTDAGVGEDGDSEFQRERKTRTILCEEIQGELVDSYPGQDAQSKKAKADLIHDHFGTRSWTAVESMPSERLREGLAAIRATLGKGRPNEREPQPPAETAEMPEEKQSVEARAEADRITPERAKAIKDLAKSVGLPEKGLMAQVEAIAGKRDLMALTAGRADEMERWLRSLGTLGGTSGSGKRKTAP